MFAFNQTLVSLWILSIVGEYVSSLSLLYFGKKMELSCIFRRSCIVVIPSTFVFVSGIKGFLCLETLPALYLRFQGEVDYLAAKSTQDMRRLFNDFNSKVLDKIPKASAKEKKYL